MADPRVAEAAETLDIQFTWIPSREYRDKARAARDVLVAVIRNAERDCDEWCNRAHDAWGQLEAVEAKLEQAREAIAWVLEDQDESRDHVVVTLREEPNRDSWFRVILPALDYEIRGGTWDEPLWAWTRHPWFRALGLTVEECEDALSASEASEEKA